MLLAAGLGALELRRRIATGDGGTDRAATPLSARTIVVRGVLITAQTTMAVLGTMAVVLLLRVYGYGDAGG